MARKYTKYIIGLLFSGLLKPIYAQSQLDPAPLNSINASPYTQSALRPDFCGLFNSIGKNPISFNDGSDQVIREIQLLPRVGANILIYPYYAFLDYQKNYINESQFWQIINNVKPCLTPLNNQFNQDYKTILTYPIGFYPNGIRYMKPWNIGESVPKAYILFSNLDLQIKLHESLQQAFNESSPEQVFEEIKHYATLLQKSKVLANCNANIATVRKLSVTEFTFSWLSQNAILDPQLIQADYFMSTDKHSKLLEIE